MTQTVVDSSRSRVIPPEFDRRYPIVNRFHDPATPLPQPDQTIGKTAAMAKAGASDF